MAAGKVHKLPEAGSRASSFRMPLLSGGEKSLEELIASGPALLAFFKVTCPVCQFTFPFLQRIHNSGKLPVYGISQNNSVDTREFDTEFGISFPMLLDSEAGGFQASNAYAISSVPTVFLVEPDGRISRVMEGWNKKDMESFAAQAGVQPFRSGEKVPDAKPG